MICKCCGEVKADWGNHRYCRECWAELRNEPKLKHASRIAKKNTTGTMWRT